MKKILFVGMIASVHLQRWVAQISDEDWDIHVFPSIELQALHPDFRNVTVHHSMYSPQSNLPATVQEEGVGILGAFIRKRVSTILWILRLIRPYLFPSYEERYLERVINRIKPDIVHSIEFQHGGYLTLKVKERMKDRFPTWLVTNYGNDIYLFGRLEEHQERVRAILEQCDYYFCECNRDVNLAESMGLRGKVMPVVPNTGGFDLEYISSIPRIDPPSKRKQILLKGYQHFSGRALSGLQALIKCADILADYRIAIYSASPEMKIAAELFQQDTSLEIDILPVLSPDEMLEQFGKSRIYMGLSISDGISISSLESILMGAFPIQSFTACADEWIIDGVSGLIVPPEDVDLIEGAIRKAITDDVLVDNAAQINWQVSVDRLDYRTIKPIIVSMYQQIFSEI